VSEFVHCVARFGKKSEHGGGLLTVK